MKNFTLLLISGLLYSGLSYAQTDQIYTRPNEKTAKAPEKKISQFMKPAIMAAPPLSLFIWDVSFYWVCLSWYPNSLSAGSHVPIRQELIRS